jgi:DNA-binding FadR family transcriptional regulator
VLEPSSAMVAPRIADAATHVLATFGNSRDDVLEARVLFETGIARLAATRATPAQREELAALIASNRAAVDDEYGYLESDLALHRAFAAMTGNALFIAISDGMLEWLRRYHEDMVRVPGASRISHREHAKIVERILARDGDGAAKAMEKHLRRSSALYRKHESARAGKPSRPALHG